MATYKVLYWQEIPSQIKAEDDMDDVTVQMPDSFQERIDLMAARRRPAGRGLVPCPMEVERGRRSRGIGGRGSGSREGGVGGQSRLVAVTINGQTTQAADGTSLFDCADGIGIPVPTSCRKQGKCKECIVEVTEGLDRLTDPTEQERHLKGNFRLSCQARVGAGADSLPYDAASEPADRAACVRPAAGP